MTSLVLTLAWWWRVAIGYVSMLITKHEMHALVGNAAWVNRPYWYVEGLVKSEEYLLKVFYCLNLFCFVMLLFVLMV